MEKTEKSENSEKPEKLEKPEKEDKEEKTEKNEKNEKNDENDENAKILQNPEDINTILTKTAKNVSNFFALSIITKVVNLFCNIVLVRHITKEAYGIAKIYFEFAFLLMVFFPRETIRKTAQKFCPDSDPKNEEKKYYITCQLHVIISSLMAIFGVFMYFSFLIFGNESVRKNQIQLLIYIVCGVIEMLSEPVIDYMNLHIENKQVPVTIGNFGRVISNMVFAVLLGLDLWSFTLSRLCGSLAFCSYLIFIGLYKYKINFRRMIPNFKQFWYGETIDGINIVILKEILMTFVKATALKMILGNCEKIILSFVLNSSTEEKGEYSFIVENFSFIIRFLLEPLEETFYNLVNKIKHFEKDKKDNTEISFRILRLFIKLMLIFGTLLIGYFFVSGKEFVELVYSKKWSTSSTEKIGQVYAIYIAIIAINGIIESFANATNNTKQMSKYNILMIINSVLLCIFSFVFSKYDICGLIFANAFSMIIRINGNLYIIFSGKNEELQKDKTTKPNDTLMSIRTDFLKFFREFYLSTPSCIVTVLCWIGASFIKRTLQGRANVIIVGCCGFIGLINVCFLYIFERRKISREIRIIKNEEVITI